METDKREIVNRVVRFSRSTWNWLVVHSYWPLSIFDQSTSCQYHRWHQHMSTFGWDDVRNMQNNIDVRLRCTPWDRRSYICWSFFYYFYYYFLLFACKKAVSFPRVIIWKLMIGTLTLCKSNKFYANRIKMRQNETKSTERKEEKKTQAQIIIRMAFYFDRRHSVALNIMGCWSFIMLKVIWFMLVRKHTGGRQRPI